MRVNVLREGGAGLLALAFTVALLACGLGGCGGRSATTTSSVAQPADTTTTAGASVSTADAGEAPPVVRIGALFPLTGELADRGAECVAAMRLAAQEVNESGGIAALGGATIEIVQADTQSDAGGAAALVEQLVKEDGVAGIVGAYQSAAVLPATEKAEELRTPFLVSSGAANEITERGLAYTFRLCPKAEYYARDQVAFLASRGLLGGRSVGKVALLHEDGDFGQETAADQRAYLASAGIEVVDEISYPADQADFSQAVLRIRSGEAQAVLTATYVDDAVLIASTAKTLHLSAPIFDAGGGTVDAEFLSRAGGDAEAILTEMEYVAANVPAQVEGALTTAMGAPPTSAGLYSYQAVWLLAEALERAGSAEGEALRAALATTSMDPSGHMALPQPVLTFDRQGQNQGARLFQVQVQHSRYVTLWPHEYAGAELILP
jgi:branched-chain amino acid transport system substrate-binding protein